MTNKTALEMTPAIGCKVTVRMDNFEVHCRVLDVKQSYGNIRLFVEPLCGSKSNWIDLSRVTKNLGNNCDLFVNPSYVTAKRKVDEKGFYLPQTIQ